MYLLFYNIYVWVQRHKLLSIFIAVFFLAGFGYLGSKIRLEEDITQIIPKSDKADLTSKAIQQINFSDKITILIEKTEKGSIADLSSLAQLMVDTLATDTNFIDGFSGVFEEEAIGETYDFVYRNLPLFLDNKDYDSLALKITSSALEEKVLANYEMLSTPTGFVLGDFIQKDPLSLGLIGLKKLQQINAGDNFILYDGFVTSKDSTKILLFVTPKYEGIETEHNKLFSEWLYAVQKNVNQQFNGKAEVSYFGSALVAVANADQIKGDIFKTILVSMSILMVLLILFYRRLYIPLIVFLPTIFAGIFAIGCLYLYKPVISGISLSIGAVLVGITIDYALHILTHFKKNEDVKTLYKELTKPLLMSGTTNAVAFLCLLFVHSEALIDLGIFAAITLVSSAVFTLLLVPHLYRPKESLKHNNVLDKLAAFPFERSRVLIILCVIVIIISIFTSRYVQFNNDIAGLNFMPTDLAKTEKKLDVLTNTTAKSLYVVATGDHLDKTLALNADVTHHLEEAKSKGVILDYSSISTLLNPIAIQKEKIEGWNSFWQSHDKQSVMDALRSSGNKMGFTEDAHEEFYTLLEKPFQTIDIEDLKELPNSGLRDFVVERNGFYTVSSLVKLKEDNRDQVIKELEVLPGVVVIDRKQLNETFLGKLKDDFNTLVGYSSIAILLILWFFFKRIELVLLAAIPIALTGLVTTGLMGVFGLEFNIFSAIVCTLVFGHGVDFSIFMTAALQKQYSTGEDELQVFRTSILLAVLTTVLAIGALVFAKHPALISIASVSLIGIFAAVLITFVFYPIIFKFFISSRAKKGKSPYTILIFVLSSISFLYYGLGCLLFSFVARFIFPIIPINKDKKKRILEFVLSKFMKSVLYGYLLIRNETLNPYKEDFKKPAAVIANHSSFLDTLTMGMLVPKMVFLVNDWVWKSPIFGKAVQSMGFYPVSNGVEGSLDVLKQKVAEGYSIVIFPEGTRSYDNSPKRFHKGAFYLAQQLNLDILPVYIHGNGDALPKGDSMIYPTKITTVIGKRILAGNLDFGIDYKERTKSISKYFKQEYRNFHLALEHDSYFVPKINLAYLYKDEEIMHKVKESLNVWKSTFAVLNKEQLLGKSILHWSDSYGELDYLLSLQDAERSVLGLIAEDESRQVASSIYWKMTRKVDFISCAEPSETLLISKKLMNKESITFDLSVYSTIINVNTENNFNYLLDKGYIVSFERNNIVVYNQIYAHR